MEHYPDPWIRRLARHSQAGTRQRAESAGDEFREGQYRGGNAASPYSVFGDSSQYSGADSGLRHVGSGVVHSG